MLNIGYTEYIMDKLISFDSDLAEKIQDYANKNHNGNFRQAVRVLCEKSLLIEGEKKNG